MAETVEVAVVGAGPAGLAAASLAAELGLSVVLLDEQPEAGGQIYRAIGRAGAAREAILGADYAAGRPLLRALDHPKVDHRPGATVWDVTRERRVFHSVEGRGGLLTAGHVILCSGALERPMPFPGWTLPGVMTAGAGQILLKAAGVLPAGPTVLAGSGPLLYLVAAQYLRAGHRPAALVETTPPENRRRALRHLPGALRAPALLGKGLGLLAEIRRAGLPHYKAAAGLRAEGKDHVAALRFTAGGRETVLPCASLLIHNGVVPNLQITRALAAEHDWDALQRCWRPRLDPWRETSLAGIAVAGDGGGIAGAEAAAASGRLAALGAARRLGALSEADAEAKAEPIRARLARLTAPRPFIDTLYAPASAFLAPPDETLVCRCEEVTAGQIRGYVKLGCLGPNQAKAFGRPGMGPCQGRSCGLTVAEVIAAERGVNPEAVGQARIRPPIKPVTLAEIAAIPLPEESAEASADAPG